MLDPLGPPPSWLRSAAEPWAHYLNLPTLPDHLHEILLAFAFYQFVHSVIGPFLSSLVIPQIYKKFSPRTKLSWDVHVVSFVQSTLINALSLWVMFADEERQHMNVGERVYGYTGSLGLLSAMATGYFLYDLILCALHTEVFGVGMLFHAISALWVFSFGFRPFLNFYAPNFLLYELSSPFLNIHWFLDKVNMTGSRAQWYNGMLLIGMFFACRLVWGTWQSVIVYGDMWRALKQTWAAAESPLLKPVDISAAVFRERNGTLCVDETCARANAEIAKFARFTAGGVPTWLILTYVVSNVVLNSLNWYWFSKMVDTVLKRFRVPTPEAVRAGQNMREKQVVLDTAARLSEEEENMATSAVDKGLSEDLRRRKADGKSSS